MTSGLQFETVYRTDNPLAQRGLGRMLYAHPEACLNKIRPIALDNPNVGAYIEAAQKFLGGR